MADLSKIKLNGTTYNIKDSTARYEIEHLPLVSSTNAGLMSPEDKMVLDNLNPNISVTISNINSNEISITNAKLEYLVDWKCEAGPDISAPIRTINLLDANDIQDRGYLNASGVLTATSSGTDVAGAYISVTPGSNIYYTGKLNPEAAAQDFRRRLHVYDSNKNWIKQINFTTVRGGNTAWSTYGTIPNNGAYVRVSWNEGDYDIMVTVGEPSIYYPYYITPFNSINSVNFSISSDGIITNENTYTINTPIAAGDLYHFQISPVQGKIWVDSGYISSYNGQTLPGFWWSDRNEYVEGTTPSIGAEVIYMLDENDIIEYDITPLSLLLFYHENYFTFDSGVIKDIVYYAETLAVNHLTISTGVTFGSTHINESDIQAWNNNLITTVNLLETKADINSPTLTGSPKATTASVGTNSTRIATTEFVQTKLNNIAPVETTGKATRSYNKDQFLIYGGLLYQATENISSGTTLSSANTATTTVAAILEQLLEI